MEATEKQCSTCATVKPLSAFTFRKERGTYKAQCKDCCRAVIDAHRYGKAVEQYKEKERIRSAERKEYLTDWQHTNRELLNERARAKNQETRAQRPLLSAVYFLTCQHTGQLFTARAKATKYSAEGRRLLQAATTKERASCKHDAINRKCLCTECNQQFTPAYGTKRRAYCSSECADNARYKSELHYKNHRKRARHYNVPYQYINILHVFERDAWHCQLCGIPTPKAKRGTYEADAPELDHIIALSQGGGHVLDNVQCSCRKCNNSKGAS